VDDNKISPEIKETEIEKSLIQAPMLLDLTPLSLSQMEREILILFVNEVANLSAVYVERIIQTAYLFRIADLHILIKRIKGLPYLNGSPYLMGFIEAYEQFKDPQNEIEFLEAIKKLEKYLLPEGKVGAEAKRQKLITEVNKLVAKNYAVPSHRSFGITLQFLKEKGYIIATKNKSKTLWSIASDVYHIWLIRRSQLFDEREQKIKEFQNTNLTASQAEIKANEYMINKHGIEVLDFYNINYTPFKWHNELPILSKQSLYLRYREDFKLFVPK